MYGIASLWERLNYLKTYINMQAYDTKGGGYLKLITIIWSSCISDQEMYDHIEEWLQLRRCSWMRPTPKTKDHG